MRRALVRRLDRRLDRAGLLRFDGASQQYPSSGAEFAALTGLTASSLYLFDEASGTLDDKVGAADLTVNATPQFAYDSGGRRGIYYDDAAARHGTDGVNIPTGASLIATCVCRLITAPGASVGAVSCLTAAADPGWGIYFNTTANDRPNMLVRDAAAGSLAVIGADVDWPTTYPGNWLWSIQIDRANTTARSRISYSGGLAGVLSGSIAGFGDLFGGTQKFAFGAGNALSGGIWVGWGAYLTGVQCEGANVLENLHKSLGWT